MKTLQPINGQPGKSLTCLALIKVNSPLAREWEIVKPAYGIYEYDKSTGTHELRWGDGSWHRLESKDFESILLLPQVGDDELADLFAP